MLFLRFRMFGKPATNHTDISVSGNGSLQEQPLEEKKEKKKSKGVTLSEHLQKSPLPSSEWCFSLMEQICDKVKEAHKEKKPHGELTLEKIRVEQNPKLMDIVGLDVKPEASVSDTPSQGQDVYAMYWRNSPVYAAPETRQDQAQDDIDGRADVFSLGVILYEMLTGQVPTTFPPAPMQEVNPDYKGFEGLEDIVQTALSTDPEDRYPSVQHFWDAIQEAKEAAKGPKSLKWSDVRKTIKKKLSKYLRKKMVKLIHKEMKLWVKQGFGGKAQAAQAGGKEAAKEATKQALDQVARQTVQAAAKQASASVYSAAASKSAAAAASSTAATAASSTVVLATKGALLVAGTTLGAVTGSHAVEAMSKLPVIQNMIQRKSPANTVVVNKSGSNQGVSSPLSSATTPTSPNPGTNATNPAGVSNTPTNRQNPATGHAASLTSPDLTSCPASWLQVTVSSAQRTQTRVTLMQGEAKRSSFGFCIPPDARQVMFQYPGRVQCIVSIEGMSIKTWSVRLQRDQYQILPPNYCLVASKK